MYCYNQNDFNKSLNDFFLLIPKNKEVKRIRKKDVYYLNLSTSFDIEVTSFLNEGKKQAIMYVWQFAINDNVIIGRTWNEYFLFLNELQKFYNLNSQNILVIYVHNLSYEFQFIRKYFNWEKVFATDERKPLYCIDKQGYEYRCSYRLSGYNLATVAKNLQKHKIDKLVGDLDYSLLRSPITELSNTELQYCINDVLIVTAYINECIEQYGNIVKIPMTQTGKVRRYVRTECFKNPKYKYQIKSLELKSMEYLQLRKAFQGGFTHCNPLFALQTIKDVTSYDFTSSYPTVMLSEKFPMSKSKYIGGVSVVELNNYIKNYCCLFDMKLTNVRSKYNFEQIISFSKCWRCENYTLNNGRVFSCDMLCTTITELDYESIIRFYDFDNIEIKNLYIYEKNYLPKEFIQSILKLYCDKTELKGVKDKEVEYLHAKEMLNSCYGMSVTDLLNDEYTYINNEWGCNSADINNEIEKYNSDKNRFLFYAWGVWVTAYARRNLFSGIYECKNDYIYADTDSIKIVNAEQHLDYINKYNIMIENKLINMINYYGLDVNLIKPKTIDGKEKLLGIWDFDGHYKLFKSLGAKRYLVLKDDNELSLTVAGVNKKYAIPYLKEKYKTIEKIFENFNDNLIIPAGHNGKKVLTYIDDVQSGIIKDYQGNYYNYNELSSIYMSDTDYNLNIACFYMDFLLKLNKKNI